MTSTSSTHPRSLPITTTIVVFAGRACHPHHCGVNPPVSNSPVLTLKHPNSSSHLRFSSSASIPPLFTLFVGTCAHSTPIHQFISYFSRIHHLQPIPHGYTRIVEGTWILACVFPDDSSANYFVILFLRFFFYFDCPPQLLGAQGIPHPTFNALALHYTFDSVPAPRPFTVGVDVRYVCTLSVLHQYCTLIWPSFFLRIL